MKTKSRSTRLRCQSRSVAILCPVVLLFICLAARAAELKVIAFSADSEKGQEGVIVRLASNGSNPAPTSEHTTGADGKCSFSDLPAGNYSLEFDRKGYIMVVPSTSVTLAVNESAMERVRAYREGTALDANTIVAFLKSRSHGDHARYEADVAALRARGEINTNTWTLTAHAATTNRSSQDVVTSTGTITSFTPASEHIRVKTGTNTEPVMYYLNKNTSVVDSKGTPVALSLLKPDLPVRFTYKSEGDHLVISKLTIAQPTYYGKKEETTTTTTTATTPPLN